MTEEEGNEVNKKIMPLLEAIKLVDEAREKLDGIPAYSYLYDIYYDIHADLANYKSKCLLLIDEEEEVTDLHYIE